MMKHLTILWTAALVLGLSMPGYGQDQTIVVSGIRLIEPTPGFLNDLSLTLDDAREIIKKVFGRSDEQLAADDTYYLLHVLKYGNSASSVEWNEWVVYHRDWGGAKPSLKQVLGDPRYSKHFTEPRVFGSGKVALIYVHINVRGFVVDDKTQANPKLSELKPEEATRLLENQPTVDLNVEVRSEREAKYDCRPPDLQRPIRIVCLETGYAPLREVVYETKVYAKTPAPTEDLNTLAEFITTPAQAAPTILRVTSESLAIYGGGSLAVRHVPSDMDVKGLVRQDPEKDPSEIGKMKFDNEGRYRWGLSFAAPMTSLDELKYERVDGVFRPRKVEKQRVYAMLNIYPWAIDTKRSTYRLLPGFMAGLAISGKALNQQLYGLNIGLWKLEAFWGHRVTRVERPGDPNSTAKPAYDISSRSTFGISLPVKTVVDLLKPEKKKTN